MGSCLSAPVQSSGTSRPSRQHAGRQNSGGTNRSSAQPSKAPQKSVRPSSAAIDITKPGRTLAEASGSASSAGADRPASASAAAAEAAEKRRTDYQEKVKPKMKQFR